MAMSMDWNECYTRIETAVRKAGSMILEAKLNAEMIHAKEGRANFVTDYDLRIQEYLILEFRKLLPEAGFYGEEETEGNTHRTFGYVFYIDPIDGTTNFMHGYDYSCVSVGLALDMKMQAGFVYNPYLDKMYRAIRGEGSYVNGRRLQIRDLELKEGVACFGSARYNDQYLDRQMDMIRFLFEQSAAIRCYGSAALDLCKVAEGANVSFFEVRLQPHDYAAAGLIIEEAGGVITQADGSPLSLDQPCSVAAGTPRAALQVREKARTYSL